MWRHFAHTVLFCRLRLKCDDPSAETRFRLSAKRMRPFTRKSAGASVQSTTGSRGVRISGSNARYTKFRGSVKITGYTLHSLFSPSLPLPCVTVCHRVSTGLYFPRTLHELKSWSLWRVKEMSMCRTVKQVSIKVRMLILCDTYIRRNMLTAIPENGTIFQFHGSVHHVSVNENTNLMQQSWVFYFT